jgi:hypothetical protein
MYLYLNNDYFEKSNAIISNRTLLGSHRFWFGKQYFGSVDHASSDVVPAGASGCWCGAHGLITFTDH